MKKTPAELMHEATRLTLAGDAAGAAALFQEAMSGQQSATSDTATVDPVAETGPSAENATEAPDIAAASFTDGVFSHHDTELKYKLFVPARKPEEPAPLLLMLHGCSQNAGDFAASTQMNDIAQASGMVVLYPSQTSSANPNKCWNWFEPAHQLRGSGEPDALSALTLHIMETQSIDPQQVFVAGFSAGGAMALILAEQYPELYSAVGVHSGLPTGVASTNMEAFSMMQGNSLAESKSTEQDDESTDAQLAQHADVHTPLIVFHGSQDRFVNVANAERIIANWLSREATRTVPVNWMPLSLAHNTATGHHCMVTTYVDEANPDITGCEYWQLSEGGHGWSGGSPGGSYTEQNGPDASTEMVRFFLEHDSVER